MTEPTDQRSRQSPTAPAIPGLRFRPFEPDADYAELSSLTRAAALFDGVDDAPEPPTSCGSSTSISPASIRAGTSSWRRSMARCPASARPTFESTAGGRSTTSTASIAPAWRRHGLGRALLGWSQDRATAVAARRAEPGPPRDLQSWVMGDQPGASALLESEGYRRHSLLPPDGPRPVRADRAPRAPRGARDPAGRAGRPSPDLGCRRRGVPGPLEQHRSNRAGLSRLVRRCRASTRACGGSPGTATRWPAR